MFHFHGRKGKLLFHRFFPVLEQCWPCQLRSWNAKRWQPSGLSQGLIRNTFCWGGQLALSTKNWSSSLLQLMQNDCQYHSCISAWPIFPYQFNASAIGWVLKVPHITAAPKNVPKSVATLCSPLSYIINIQLFLWFMGRFWNIPPS